LFTVLALFVPLTAACGNDVEEAGDDDPSHTTSGVTASSGASGATSGSGGGSTGSSSGAGAGGQGGAVSEVCASLQDVTVSNPVLHDSDDDGIWTPGELVTLTVTLTSPFDNTNYPGVSVSHGVSQVTPDPANNWLFGLLANEPAPIEVSFEASAATPAGTAVTFTVDVVTINERCAGLDSLTFLATVE
jgi:hypothetical protein